MKLRRTSYARLQMQMRMEALQQSHAQPFSENNWSYSNLNNKIVNQRKLDCFRWPNASVARQNRLTGNGRFGKRPPSFTIERGGHFSCDNSNDSGLGWDSNSESQLSWESTEDFRSVGGYSSAGSSTPSPPFKNRACEKFGLLGKPELSSGFIDIKPLIGSPFSNQTTTSAWSSGKILPARTITEISPMMVEETEPLQTFNNPTTPVLQSLPVSQVPVKRTRFNFQTPATPSKSGSGLKLRNQNQNSGDYQASRNSSERKPPSLAAPVLASSLAPVSKDGRVQLHILAQPEEQHRARYQTEGSRGAIKDRKGNGFPAAQLIGYDKPATLQIFIGTDQGKVSPHMFYQACKVSGKSSTPCNEKKVEGTMLIEIEFDPSKEMHISCDCVGILKERNVDVEQRFPFHQASSSRKKSTKCRLIFRTTIINSEGMEETLLAASLPILCTQPPGQPEICKKSLSEFSAAGGEEFFIIGKNFLKDTKVVFQEESSQGELLWEARAEVLKDYLQQNHLICIVPPYKDEHIMKAVDCKVAVCSGGKMSEPNRFTYLPNFNTAHIAVAAQSGSCVANMSNTALQQQLTHGQPTLSLSLPDGGSLVQTTVESIIGNTLQHQKSGNMVQVSELEAALVAEERRASLSSAETVSFENALMSTTMQHERHVVCELQSLLDQSSQQGLSDINDAKEREGIIAQSHINIGTTISFLGQGLGEGQTLHNMVYQNNDVPITQSPMSISLQLTSYPELTHQQLSPNVNVHQFQNTDGSTPISCLMDSGIRDMLNLNTVSVAHSGQQHLAEPNLQNTLLSGVQAQVNHSHTGGMTAMGASSGPECLTTPSMMNGTPLASVRIGGQNGHILTSGVNMMNIMSGEIQMQQHEVGLTNAITQMSDNELLNYINPSCFDQVMKCC